MDVAKKNIFLTGAPSSGKTTVIKKVIKGLDFPANGFFTEEERKGDKRTGFTMKTLDGRSGYLARRGITSPFRIRNYGVSIDNIEMIAVPSLVPEGDNIIVLDEIGRMECFSEAFRRAVLTALDSPNVVVGTITFGGDDFINEVKRRDDIDISEVTPENRERMPEVIIGKVRGLLG